MQAILLFVSLTLVQVGGDPLLARLDKEFESLLENDQQWRRVREVGRTLAVVRDSNTDIRLELRTLAETRSKAAVPLLLINMLRHSKLPGGERLVQEHLEMLRALTGAELQDWVQPQNPNLEQQVRGIVEEFVDGWWTENQNWFTKGAEHWPDDVIYRRALTLLQRVQSRVLGKIDRDDHLWMPNSSDISSLLSNTVFYSENILTPGRLRSYEELSPKMIDVFLARSGYAQDPAPRSRDVSLPTYGAIEPLAVLRKRGRLRSLHEIAANPKQTAGTRLTCALALCMAGEPIPVPIFLDIAKNDKILERRLVAILVLGRATNSNDAMKLVVDSLNDPNREIQLAAMLALSEIRGPRPLAAIPKLKRIIEQMESPEVVDTALNCVSNFGNRNACLVIVNFMESALEEEEQHRFLPTAVASLRNATSQLMQSSPQPTQSSQGNIQETAREAIRWWNTNNRRRNK